MKIKRYPVERIEQALRLWEDALYLHQMAVTALNNGVVDLSQFAMLWYWREFRDFLLHADENTPFDEDRFSVRAFTGKRLPDFCDGDLLAEADFDARAFFAWVTCSRRVYHLDREMTHLLSNTSLHTLTWNEIKIPFNGFAITLEKPLFSGEMAIDCLLVWRDQNTGDIWISGYQQDLEKWAPIGRNQKQKFVRQIRRRQWGKIVNAVSPKVNRLASCGAQSIHLPTLSVSNSVTGTANHLRAEMHSVGERIGDREENADQFYQLVGSLCLYLSSLPPDSSHVESREHKRSRNLDRRAIVWEADIATVVNCYELTDEEHEWLEDGTSRERYELSAHWRRGHWRRPKGKGDDPDAKKTVWVRPTLVRKDRLPPGGQPGGTRVNITAPGNRSPG